MGAECDDVHVTQSAKLPCQENNIKAIPSLVVGDTEDGQVQQGVCGAQYCC